jgi:hypothetical protein
MTLRSNGEPSAIVPAFSEKVPLQKSRISRHDFPFELGEVLRSVCSGSRLDMAKGERCSFSLLPPHIKRQGESRGPLLWNNPVERARRTLTWSPPREMIYPSMSEATPTHGSPYVVRQISFRLDEMAQSR